MKSKITPPSDRKFFFMVAATIVFQVQLEDGNPESTVMNSVAINGVVTHTEDKVPAKLLGKAQQVVQLQFAKKMGDDMPKVNVVDVVIMNLMNLGYMSDEEFNATPDGMKQQEAAAAPAAGKAKLSVVANGASTLQ
jgi:hypothetical protein